MGTLPRWVTGAATFATACVTGAATFATDLTTGATACTTGAATFATDCTTGATACTTGAATFATDRTTGATACVTGATVWVTGATAWVTDCTAGAGGDFAAAAGATDGSTLATALETADGTMPALAVPIGPARIAVTLASSTAHTLTRSRIFLPDSASADIDFHHPIHNPLVLQTNHQTAEAVPEAVKCTVIRIGPLANLTSINEFDAPPFLPRGPSDPRGTQS